MPAIAFERIPVSVLRGLFMNDLYDRNNGSLQSYTIAGGGDQAGPGLPVNLGSNRYGASIGLKHTF